MIKQELRQGRILDIGCGIYPYFLINTVFNEKHGVDPETSTNGLNTNININHTALNENTPLPYEDQLFSVVTSLAVIEHFTEDFVRHLMNEAHRVLQPGGQLILTTPSPWSHQVLQLMGRLNIVSHEEIRGAVNLYSQESLSQALHECGFPKENISFGFFECGLNSWIRALR